MLWYNLIVELNRPLKQKEIDFINSEMHLRDYEWSEDFLDNIEYRINITTSSDYSHYKFETVCSLLSSMNLHGRASILLAGTNYNCVASGEDYNCRLGEELSCSAKPEDCDWRDF